MLAIDRFMTRFIKVGGIGIIAAVLGMLVFIAAKVLPLFSGAELEPAATKETDSGSPPLALGIDEWGELPFVVSSDGVFRFYDGKGVTEKSVPLGGDGQATVVAASYDAVAGFAMLALSSGEALPVEVKYERPLGDDGQVGAVQVQIDAGEPIDLGLGTATVDLLAFSESEEARLIAATALDSGDAVLKVHRYTRKRSLLGEGKLTLSASDDLSHLLDGAPRHLLVNGKGDSVIIGTGSGEILYLFASGDDDFEIRQRFRPFPEAGLARADYLLGDSSLSLASTDGENRIYSLFRPGGEGQRVFGETKILPDLPSAATSFARSHRNRSFLLAAGDTLSLRHATSGDIRWEGGIEVEPNFLAISKKHDRIAALARGGDLLLLDLDDPHPEAGMRAFFGKIWYEDAPAPSYSWQSTGGSDEFEPKLSLIPLIHGTLKGTFYAMLFAFPVALLAAIYTSQFLHPDLKAVVKPVMEIMASLPSVVLGFLGALWLAPRIETHTVSIALVVVFVPLSAFLLGWGWSRLPIRTRNLVRPGYEFAVFVPIILLGIFAFWHIGPVVERLFFSAAMPDGSVSHDFRDWWRARTGLRFEPRNCVVIGLMMGFAVIPIIFTITEDALSSVPPGLRSASLALGASRWQTAWRVVLPTASAGIFSATMIGLGRAVGETMIVVMATGNTPIMEWNIFSGMRTLSANIAVELPEAPENGTLYRTLFLGALVLFLMTFVLNTLAEVLRQHLREKYKTV